MANPIKASDLYQDDGAIEKAIKELTKLGKTHEETLEQVKAEAIKVQVQVQKLNAVTGEHREDLKETATAAEDLKKKYDAQKKAMAGTSVEIERMKQAQAKRNAETRLEAKLMEAQEGSYDRLSAQYAIMKMRLNAMSAAQRKATQEGQDLEKQSNEIYEEMKRLQEATGKHVLSVGDYEKATRNLLEELRDVPGAAGSAAQGLEGLKGKFMALVKNPLVLTIGLIVGALSGLFAAFKRTETGANVMAKVSGTLNGIWSVTIGLVSDLLDGVMKAFKDPQQAMKDFWTSLKENIVNRFEGVINLVKSLGGALKGLWDRDLEAIRTAAKDAGQALIQMGTGLDVEQQKAFTAAIKEQTDAVAAQVKAFGDLELSRRAIAAENRRLATSVEALITKEQVLGAIRDTATKSWLEREQAGADLADVLIEKSKLQIQIERNNLRLIDQDLAMRRKNGENVADLEEQRLAAFQALSAAQREYTMTVLENERERAQIVQDRLEIDLDILIDTFENQKGINERIIADERQTIEKRRALLAETKDLADRALKEQVATLQQMAQETIDINDLIATSDAVMVNEKIRGLGLSEIGENRLREVIQERRNVVQDLIEAERDLMLSEQEALKAGIAAAQAKKQADLEAEQTAFESMQALEASRFELTKASEADRTRFELEAERAKLQKMLQLNEAYQQGLTATQLETIDNQIKAIDQKLAQASQSTGSIYDLFGLNLKEEEKQLISDSFSFAKEQLNAYFAQRVEQADALVQKSGDQVEAARAELDTQIALEQAGYASRVQQAQKELDLAKANQKKALKEQEKAQQAQQALQGVQQAANLVTASSKILAEFSLPFALLALGVMWGAFAAAQVKAFTLTKKQYGAGGYEAMNFGGSHASGNDIPLGMTSDGRQRTVERGEGLGIFSRKSVRQYGAALPQIVNAINQGTFQRRFAAIDAPGATIYAQAGTDTRKVEKELGAIRMQGERQIYTDAQGRTVEIFRNRKRTYE
jgi:hypothetical protein